MSIKIDSPSAVEPRHGQTAVSTSTSSFSSSSPKVSMFGAKSGFVIPKNKLSGSLVPIFRGGSKVDVGSTVKEETTKQVQRKTKWGTDLNQDAAVRKGKALAYQTRVEQISQQLKSGSLEFGEDQVSDSSKLEGTADSASDLLDIKSQKVELLELERRELIGEILRLNPSYKAPPDYKPLLKESKVPIPIKAHPSHNFIGLLLGPESNTQKRLEEETGAKVRVYGTNSDSRVECEITKSDVNEAQDVYEELHVHVSGDTYEKVDAAVALIELLLTPVSDNNTKDFSSSSVNKADVQIQDQGSIPISQGVPAPSSIPVRPVHPPFQPHQALWFPGTPPNVVSGQTSVFMPPTLPSNSSQFPILRTTSSVPQNFTQPRNFGPIPRVPSPVVSRPQPSFQLPLNQYSLVPTLQPFSAGPMATLRPPAPVNPQIGPPLSRASRPAVVSPGPPLTARPGINQRVPLSSNVALRPQFPPFPSTPLSSGPQLNLSANFARPPVADYGPHSAPLFSSRPPVSLPILSSAPPQIAFVATTSGAQVPQPSPTPVSPSPVPISAPKTSPAPIVVRPHMPVPAPAPAPPLQHTPIPASPPPPVAPVSSSTTMPVVGTPGTAPKPLRPISGDFTFQPLRTQPPSSPNSLPPNSPVIQKPQPVIFPAQRAPSFQPAQISLRPQQVQHPPLRPEATLIPSGALVPPFPSNANNIRTPPPPMLLGYPNRSLGRPLAQATTPFVSPSFPPTNLHHATRHQFLPSNRPGGTFPVPNQQLGGNAPTAPRGNQIYDPFSPTASAAASQQGSDNPANNRNPETDAEYEDLMASVGVK